MYQQKYIINQIQLNLKRINRICNKVFLQQLQQSDNAYNKDQIKESKYKVLKKISKSNLDLSLMKIYFRK